MSLVAVDLELTQKNKVRKLGFLIVGNEQRFLFCPPENYKPNQQTTWNTSHLHGIAWSSEKFEYGKLFNIFHDINTMNAEEFVKGVGKCKLVLRSRSKCRKLG